jgi:type I restriction enzyme S subunit
MTSKEATNKPFYNTEIPSDWSAPEFGDVFNFLKTFSFSREQLTNEPTINEIRNIHYGDIHSTYENEILDLDIEKTIPYLLDGIIDPKSFEDENFPALKEGDLIIADASEDYEGVCSCIELKNINGAKVVSGLHTFAARTTNDKIALRYRTYALQHEQVIRELRRIATGTSVFGVSKTNLSKVKIPLPPLPEQKAIAQVLSTADAAIHTTEKIIAQKVVRKKWLMQQLLTGKKRLKGFEGEWKEQKLSDLFDRVTRKNTEGNTTVVTISAQRGFVRQTDFFNKNIASEITDNYFLVERGEFCYNKSYSNGYPWGATKRLNDFDKAVVTTLYICFGIKDEKKTNSKFFEQYFGANHLDKGLTKIAHEGGRAHGLLNVTPSDFFSLKVTVPSYLEQTAIAQFLKATDKEISLLKDKAEKLREQKKGFMQQLLTGKVRLKIKNETK